MIDKLHIIRYDIHDMIKYTLLIRITRLFLEIYVIYIKIKRIMWSNKAVDIDVLLHIIYIVIRLSNIRAEILNMMEKYISSQGLLIQCVHLLLLIRLRAIYQGTKIKEYINNLYMATGVENRLSNTFDCKQISTATVGGLSIYDLFSSSYVDNEVL